MASTKVTGKTRAELRQMRREHESKPRSQWYEFDDYYCLSRIPRQPDGYDGPARFCPNVAKSNGRCKFHGGNNVPHPETLDKLANLKHGMNATRRHLREAMKREGNEWQVELYDWIVEEWPEAYDIDLSNDPQATYEFHALAIEIVRAERAEGYIIGEGEKNQRKIFGPDGSVHYEDVPHYLADMMQRQRKLVMKMEDNLGISRKARLKAEKTDEASDIIKTFAEVGASLITKSDKKYDPDEFGGPSEDEDQ